MTVRTKTRRSAAGRKKSRGRARRGTSAVVPGLVTVPKAYRIEESAPPTKESATTVRGRPDALTSYLGRIGDISDLLTAKEEIEMATRIQRSLAASVKALKAALPEAEPFRDWKPSRQSAKTPDKITRAQELLKRFNPQGLRGAELMKRIDDASRGALGLAMLAWHEPDSYRTAERFIHANLRLVINLARRYARPGYMSLEDLIQEGNAGLVIAVLRFDPKKGFRFSTYGTWWIRHGLSRSMADSSRLIRLPVYLTDLSQKVGRVRQELTARLGRPPTDDELSKAAECPKKKLAELRSALYEPCSLDEPIDDDSGKRTLIDVLAVDAPEPDDWATLHPEKSVKFLRDAIEELPPIMQSILRLRFGFDDDGERTLREIGEKYRLSRERIRQLQESGLKKLRLRLTRSFAAI